MNSQGNKKNGKGIRANQIEQQVVAFSLFGIGESIKKGEFLLKITFLRSALMIVTVLKFCGKKKTFYETHVLWFYEDVLV